ncbi:membrane protein insertase YidC [Adhaeribacter pallidiroseus]|uniref:Membrane protein insertase YidC n=1 Tax=Adhaeribacter pallidiroseus TaxID=2072847 RepID=A0A369QGC9_9BACT|nr:membrane protein insertase YidC [Adhaeribacter pallidiroseus]RDC63472.1 Membrane protein insertase YidC [Adhaeribacter pallidiroseus]
MEKNQAVGLVIISVLLIVYMTFFAPKAPPKPAQEQQTTTASTNFSTIITPATIPDSVRAKTLGEFGALAQGTAQEVILENKNLRITLSNKGGKVDEVLLKNYKTWDKKPLILFDKVSSYADITFLTNSGKAIRLSDLYFKAQPVTNQNGAQVLAFSAEVGAGQSINQTYTLASDGFTLDYKVNFKGLNQIVANKPLTFNWNDRLKKTEFDLKQNRDHSRLNVMMAEDDFDYLVGKANETDTKKLETPIKWVSNKQNFFSAAIIAKNTFASGDLKVSFNQADTTEVKTFATTLAIPVNDVLGNGGEFTYFFGPNDFTVLKQLPFDFERNLELGWGIFSYVNKLLIIPVFHFLERFISSYGIIIVLLVLFIKTLLFPLTYKSYLSMAKMRVLKPEIDAIKEKNDGDMQKTQSETMKLYSEVGVNPMSGCIPVVLSIPVLFALFNFFPNSIELRQEPFLWAQDLSTYDVFARLPFTIPFYGNHVSMFTLLMTASTILYTWSNNQVNTSIQGPMKFYSYLMPLVFLFVVNSLPAGLSFYYFVANIITFGQQELIKRFVDEDKIREKLISNKEKNKNKQPGGFQKRLQEAMKAASEREAQQKKGSKK